MSSKSIIVSAATLFGVAICVLCVLEVAQARPSLSALNSSRTKRFSDQKILDIEARIALAKLRGRPVIGSLGQIDPGRAGRTRRSNIEPDLKKLRRILRSDANDEDDRGIRMVQEFLRWLKYKEAEAESNRVDDYDGLY
ncbi:uncharacterized protein LOC106640213 [Copidosoma floridanum]|uniref:uncharacterized protein LOC106640213 n=1 Tax=Copidosoma floridanum TaxID=29053 RepID=UPI0006C98B55|nr:uncharacterized protein LOC106640213 [Copidosoma floridanum]